MAERDLEGKDLTIYGDVLSTGYPIEEFDEKTDSLNLFDAVTGRDFGPLLPAQPPIETIEE